MNCEDFLKNYYNLFEFQPFFLFNLCLRFYLDRFSPFVNIILLGTTTLLGTNLLLGINLLVTNLLGTPYQLKLIDRLHPQYIFFARQRFYNSARSIDKSLGDVGRYLYEESP
jgi:hypothetical protein